MNIFISGGLGLVGRNLSSALLKDNHQVTVVGRSENPSAMIKHPAFHYLAADTTKTGSWQETVADHDIVINLTGKSIFTFWTQKVKKEIYDSRVLTTKNIADSLAGAGKTIFFSTSAIGYYGDRGDDLLTEEEPVGDDFLAGVCRDWEREALKAQSENIRVVLTRFGIVLDEGGGAMASMIPLFKFMLGGRLGSGLQWFPWIHLHDLIAAYLYAIDHPEVSGPVNWCAPNPVRNQDLTRNLAQKLGRPALFPVPRFVIKTVLGEFGKALICSQRAQPGVLEKAGFQFGYGEIGSALNEIIRK